MNCPMCDRVSLENGQTELVDIFFVTVRTRQVGNKFFLENSRDKSEIGIVFLYQNINKITRLIVLLSHVFIGSVRG